MKQRHQRVEIISGKGSFSQFAAGRAAEFMEITQERGALLFRGFEIHTPVAFHESATELTGGLVKLAEESSPRSEIHRGVFTATDYSAEFPIQFHSEHSYAYEWPLHLVFGCLRPARSGGRTLLSDTRRVLRNLDAALVQEFMRRKILYIRQYSAHRGVSWQTAFGAESLEALAEICAQRGIGLETAGNGLVRTRQVGPAVRCHPRTEHEVWFNHAFLFSVASIEPDWLRNVMRSQPPEALITQAYFGDGAEISDATIDLIGRAYKAAMLEPFDWEPGDMLIIDNMLAAHSREAYTGDRQVLVAMANAVRGDAEGTQHQSNEAAAAPGRPGEREGMTQ